jgi:hypothetical protein
MDDGEDVFDPSKDDFHQNVHTDLEPHTATYSVGTMSSFFREKLLGLEAVHHLAYPRISFEKVIVPEPV